MIRITSDKQPESLFEGLIGAATLISRNQELLKQMEVTLVKDVAKKSLKDLGPPEDFRKNYTELQRSYILSKQITKASLEQLKPYLLADKTYMIQHYGEGQIPDDFYYHYDDENKSLHLSSDGADDAQLKQILASVKAKVKHTLRSLDLRQFHNVTTLEALSPLELNHLEHLDCTEMHDLKSLKGLPESAVFDELILDDCSQITDIGPLEGKLIERLSLKNCFEILDYSPLLNIRKLKRVDLKGCINIASKPEALAVIRALMKSGVTVKVDQLILYSYTKYLKSLTQTEKRDLKEKTQVSIKTET